MEIKQVSFMGNLSDIMYERREGELPVLTIKINAPKLLEGDLLELGQIISEIRLSQTQPRT